MLGHARSSVSEARLGSMLGFSHFPKARRGSKIGFLYFPKARRGSKLGFPKLVLAQAQKIIITIAKYILTIQTAKTQPYFEVEFWKCPFLFYSSIYYVQEELRNILAGWLCGSVAEI